MKKTILIGSIFSVFLLILASMPSVVSYNEGKITVNNKSNYLLFEVSKYISSISKCAKTTTGIIGIGFVVLTILYIIWNILFDYPLLMELYVKTFFAILFALVIALDFLFSLSISLFVWFSMNYLT